jgi:hypothetical protein
MSVEIKLSEAREAYEALSGKASDIIRQLSLAAIGLAWIFHTGDAANIALDVRLKRGVIFAVAALFVDLLQYLIGTALWASFHSLERHRGKLNTDDVKRPLAINWPAWTLFAVKAVLMGVSYGVFILPYLWFRF